MDVSIIIVNFNKFNYLNNCLRSITRFTTGISYEIIIIDNNSTEGLITVVTNQFDNIKLIKNPENKGFAAANNQGIEIAKGKYSLILNNDTELVNNSIKEVFDYSENYGKDMVAGIQLLNSNGSKQESAVPFPSLLNILTENLFLYRLFPKSKVFNKYYMNEISLSSPTDVDVVKGAFLFTKTEILRKVGGFDEKFFFYSEETDLCYRLKQNLGVPIILLPNINLYHHNNSYDKLKPWFHFKNVSLGKIKFYQKHFKNIKFATAIMLHSLGNLLRFFTNIFLAILKLEPLYFKKSYYYILLLFIYPKNQFSTDA